MCMCMHIGEDYAEIFHMCHSILQLSKIVDDEERRKRQRRVWQIIRMVDNNAHGDFDGM